MSHISGNGKHGCELHIPQLIPIPVGTRVPTIDEPTVISFLSKLKRTAPGPDGLPYWLWKDFAQL